LRERIEAIREARDEAERARDELAEERDRYREEAERLKGRVEELEAEVDRLESELDELSAAGDVGTAAAGPSLTPERALRETNLFVRYRSKSGGTLEKAHAGEATRSDVNDNLRIEHHTRFESEAATVEGRPFDEFLADTIEYGFVRWVVADLLYEIGETGNGDALADLFDAIPEIDRAELHGEVSLDYEEDGEERREQETFDVVFRDRMGNPLLVANVNDSREPTTGEAMESLVERSERLKESNESLGGAVAVTASYFDPDALETAQDATGGGLFSRGKKLSYVRLSRKRGYHLCLVETREGNFHLNVPEL
jgi:prefoldin subunit 5